ncbi:hypothetical protein [Mesorhizobium sp.]|uniref:hypothetical protein n=1 Tax=Mesorhizobium sp. TaxID=1871066 RepID=UPI0012232120|nr:hypothetical protein [Mesorhizobium sp.]TIP18410.1 MAG: hypothetical protein E5X66_15605 [Mesorhizobium sp.]
MKSEDIIAKYKDDIARLRADIEYVRAHPHEQSVTDKSGHHDLTEETIADDLRMIAEYERIIARIEAGD